MKYFYWNKVPLLRLLFPFVAGIVSAVFIDSFPLAAIITAVFSISMLLLLHLTGYIKNNHSKRWLFGIFVNLLFLCAGNLLTSLHVEINDEKHFSYHSHEEQLYVGYLTEPLKEKDRSYKTVIEITSIIADKKLIPVKGKLLTYISKDSLSSKLNYGDQILFKANHVEISEPQNPYEFNYKRFLSFNKIYHQAYIKTGNITVSGTESGNELIYLALKTQEKLLNVFKESKITGNEYAVLSALMLGYKDDLDTEIKQAYSSSGAMHVLAVSGLHVGIIFLAISKALFFLDRKRWQIILKGVIIILFLWCYAFITGLSPSVMRSATMLSFVVGGSMFSRDTNIYNILAASAFALLLIDPYLIMAVGFQLSYLAVIGIVAIQPKIYNLVYPRFWIVRQTWAIICVSIAAQIATAPLGMLYYHQFPNYFLFSNIVVIPLATIILYGGLLLFLLSALTPVADIIAVILNKAVLFLNSSVFFIEKLPNSITQGISHSVLDTWIIYFIIIFGFLALLMKCKRQLFASLALVLVFAVFTAAKKTEDLRRHKIVVFNVNGSRAYNFISGRDHVFIADSALISDENRMIFHVQKYWDNEGLNNPTIFYTESLPQRHYSEETGFFIKNNYVKFGTRKIFIKTDGQEILINKIKPEIDLIILSTKNTADIVELTENYNFEKIILDSARPDYIQKKFREKLKNENVNYYCVKEKGYYELEL